MQIIWLFDFISVFGFSILGFLSIYKEAGPIISIVLFILLVLSLIDLTSSFYSMRTVINLVDQKIIDVNKKE